MVAKKTASIYVCQQCQSQSSQWLGRCPECGSWNSLVETVTTSEDKKTERSSESKVYKLSLIPKKDFQRIQVGIAELDLVLGGGMVEGSVVLVAGEPGIGKSTLLLQVADSVSRKEKNKVLYVSGEESARQIKLRAQRMKIDSENILIFSENNVEIILEQTEELKPSLIIVDSIQTLFTNRLSGVPGSVGQVKESAAQLLRKAKREHIPVFLIGHVTKEGAVAGPKVLEHLVDTVLYLEGDKFHTYRVLRAIKNRFGSTSEVGIFEMREKGLEEVKNPSKFFLSERKEKASGSIVVATLEGQRPILVEIQALVTRSSLAIPRRTVSGVDYNRLLLLSAVLAKKLGLNLNSYDIYVNVAGGLRINEPGIDLGVCLAIISSLKDKPFPLKTAVFGEVGLLGEVRKVNQSEKRIKEARKLGFINFITPIEISNLNQAVKRAFRSH